MNENIVVSPCISVCKTDPVSGYCYGCGRTNEDKVFWKIRENGVVLSCQTYRMFNIYNKLYSFCLTFW